MLGVIGLKPELLTGKFGRPPIGSFGLKGTDPLEPELLTGSLGGLKMAPGPRLAQDGRGPKVGGFGMIGIQGKPATCCQSGLQTNLFVSSCAMTFPSGDFISTFSGTHRQSWADCHAC